MNIVMRRSDIRFYAILALVVITIVIIYKSSRPRVHDFREKARAQLQLSSGVVQPSNCPAEDKSTEYGKSVSVIVSTQAGEEAVITQTVNSIIAHTDPKILQEIIIAVDAKVSEDHLVLLQKEFSGYEVLVKILQGHSDMRIKNKLVMGHMATGDVIMFIDDSVVVTANYMAPLLGVLHDHPEVNTDHQSPGGLLSCLLKWNCGLVDYLPVTSY